ncbi:MAG TPA: capsule assembly Wzi family protein [Steroidobacteraceae bacterium]|nr:capsule assembly Wzi family protein [Steroidobacteraceae bacterium]
MSPEIERQVEQVMILAGRPIVRRPIAAATVLEALPDACKVDEVLCNRVRKYLDRYMRHYAVTDASIEAATTEDSGRTRPNSRGMSEEGTWAISASVYYQPSDHALLQLGGVAYPDEAIASGSMLSLGWEYAQLDLGFRDHWWSPMSDSSMLISTQAKTMPGITLSNYTPITKLGFQYEVFMAEMSRVDDIVFEGGTVSGKPRLFGTQVSIAPVRGWSLSASRILQYGGGPRDDSLSGLFDAFFTPGSDNREGEFGNQTAALTSQFVFPAAHPFAVYFQYAGEDGSRSESWRLGNVSLSAGIDLPRLWNRFDLTYEVSDWQNGWYVHHIYPEGQSNDGHVIGHWGGDDRAPLDGVGAQSHSLRIGWSPRFGGRLELRYRTLANEDYSGVDYEREHDLALSYSRSAEQFVYGAEINVGRDVFGEDFARVGGFLRLAPGLPELGVSSVESGDDGLRGRVQIFVDGGVNVSRLKFNPSDKGATPETDISTTGPHVAIGVRGAVSEHSDLGTRVELDEIDGSTLIGVRALDYRYRIGEKLALTAFAGAARYGVATAAYGYYGGVGAQWREILSRVDLGLDLRFTDKVSRDALLPSDPASVWGDVYYQVYSANLYLSYRF